MQRSIPDAGPLLAMLDAMDQPALATRRGVILAANPAFCRIVGRSLAELRDLPDLLAIVAPDAQADLTRRYQAGGLFVQASLHAQTTLLRPDGARVPVEFASAPLEGAGDDVMISTLRDLTHWEALERELRESRHRLELLAESTLEVVVVHEGGHVVEANPATERLLGYTADEMRGKLITDFVAPAHRDKAVEVMRSGSEDPYEADVLRKDGAAVPVEIRARTIHRDGRHARVVVVRDITTLRAMEASKRDQLVARRVVHRLLQGLGPTAAAQRALGRGLACEAPLAIDAALRTYASMGLGVIRGGLSGARYVFEATELLERAPGKSAPSCHIALGFLEGIVAQSVGTDALGAETACQSQCHARCTFVVKPRTSSP